MENLEWYLKKISDFPMLSEEEIRKYTELLKIGTEIQKAEAQKKLVEGNLRLVVHFAKKYAKYINRSSIMDIIQEGNIGLIIAVQRFNMELNSNFSTYASFWIKNSMIQFINNERIIKIPENIFFNWRIVGKAENSFFNEHGYFPNIQELAEKSKLTIEEIEKAKKVFSCLGNVSSLDEFIGEQEDATIQDFVKDEKTSYIVENLIEKDATSFLIKQIHKVFEEDEMAIKVFDMRYGNFGTSLTIIEIAKVLNITPERVRKIEAKLLRKIRFMLQTGKIKY